MEKELLLGWSSFWSSFIHHVLVLPFEEAELWDNVVTVLPSLAHTGWRLRPPSLPLALKWEPPGLWRGWCADRTERKSALQGGNSLPRAELNCVNFSFSGCIYLWLKRPSRAWRKGRQQGRGPGQDQGGETLPRCFQGRE